MLWEPRRHSVPALVTRTTSQDDDAGVLSEKKPVRLVEPCQVGPGDGFTHPAEEGIDASIAQAELSFASMLSGWLKFFAEHRTDG